MGSSGRKTRAGEVALGKWTLGIFQRDECPRGLRTVTTKAQGPGNEYRSVSTGFQHFFRTGLSEKFREHPFPPLDSWAFANINGVFGHWPLRGNEHG